MIRCCLFILLLFTTISCHQNKSLKNSGFHDIQLGKDYSDLKYQQLTLVEDAPEHLSKYYEKTEGNFFIGKSEISSIVYGFYKDKLYFIIFKLNGRLLNKSDFFELASTLYENTAFISYDEDLLTNSSEVLIISNDISNQKTADLQDRGLLEKEL